jgi:DNA-binding HxlR family transcriptional regulator
MEPLQDLDIPRLRRVLRGSAMNRVLERLGDRWTWEVIRQAFLGVRRFDDFQSALGIPRPTLSARLRALVQEDILRRERYQERPARWAYRLTPKGLALYPRALLAWDWQLRWGAPASDLPRRLRHRPCGHAFRPRVICETCGTVILPRDLDRELIDPGDAQDAGATRARRWSGALPERGQPGREGPVQFAQLISDRHAMRVLIAVLLGCRHFASIREVLEIGTSVLAIRLDMLVRMGLLEKGPDPADGRRFVYRLGRAARGLTPYMLLLSRWGQQHMLHGRSTIRVRHRTCGQVVRPSVVCSHCHQPLLAHEVERG